MTWQRVRGHAPARPTPTRSPSGAPGWVGGARPDVATHAPRASAHTLTARTSSSTSGSTSGRLSRWVSGRFPDGGEAGGFVVELAWLMPVLVLMLFAGVQFAWWYDARATCHGAAAAGADAAAVMNAGAGAGTSAAYAFLSSPSSSVQGVSVSEADGATQVSVTCSGRSQELIPLPLNLSVTQTVTAPKERWVTP